jgi:ABC-type Mn2+/Zn2+ transport system permease subunit
MGHVIAELADALQYGFVQRALLAGSLIAVCSAFLGIFLVLKKYSMIGDGLAHVSFATIAIALLLSASPLAVSIPLVTLSSFLILKLTEKAHIHGDAAIAMVSSFSIALGVLIASVAGGFNIDLFSYLFGSILLISGLDLVLSVILSIVVIVCGIFLYNSLFAITYDEEYARAIGIKTRWINYAVFILTSITIVLGIRIAGTLLIPSMIIFPTVTALQLSRGFKVTIIIALCAAVFSVVVGILLSYVLEFPAGASIVMINALLFCMAFIVKKLFRPA